jgi:hypothetical protein
MRGRACQVCGHPVAEGQPVWFCTVPGQERNREPGFHAGCTTYRVAFSLTGDDGPWCLTTAEARAATRKGRAVLWAWAAFNDPAFYTIGEWLRQPATEGR